MADKASRGIVVYGDGLMPFVSPSHANIHRLASLGACGFLSLTDPPPSISENEDERVVRELAQLLDAYDFYIMKNEKKLAGLKSPENLSTPTLSERFMGLKAAILTKNSSVKSFATYLGLTVLELDAFIKNHSLDETLMSQLLLLLGFQGGKIGEVGEFDLLFVHIEPDEKEYGNQAELINELVGGILQSAQPGTEICSRLHCSLVMSYGALSGENDHSVTSLISQVEKNHSLSFLIPRQSYTIKGSSVIDNIRHHSPMLITQWQEAVTRKDLAETFSFNEFKERGANLAIPADRFLHEVAFKLWKAPKYGA